jgi:hypothetical protein
MPTNNELKPKTKFPLDNPILKNSGIPKTEVDLEIRFMAMKTYKGEFITMWLPPSNADIPEYVESALKFANIPNCFIEKIVKYFKELVYWPPF